MVEVSVGWGGQFQGSETDVIKSLVVDDHYFVGVLYQLVHGEGRVVRFNNGVGNLGGWED